MVKYKTESIIKKLRRRQRYYRDIRQDETRYGLKMWGHLFSRGTKFVQMLNLRADEGIPDQFYATNEDVLC